jgi:uncharacterized protein (UPF0332 family)
MNPLAQQYLKKSIEQLDEAQGCAKDGHGMAAGHFAYVAALNAATAFLVERGMVIKPKKKASHKSINVQFAGLVSKEPKIPKEFHSILPQMYDLKRIADYELGPDAKVPLDRAQAAIERVSRFVDCISELLNTPSNTPRNGNLKKPTPKPHR